MINIVEGTPKGINLFIPPINEIVISAICLAIILTVVVKVAIPKFYKILDDRSLKIEQQIKDASTMMDEAKQLQQKNQQDIFKMKKEADAIQKKTHEQAQQIISTAQKKAEKEYTEIIKNAQAKIKQDSKQMKEEVKQYATDSAVELSKKILTDLLKDKSITDKIFDKMTT
jgi:F-type H+-transporting ATPase subunit b